MGGDCHVRRQYAKNCERAAPELKEKGGEITKRFYHLMFYRYPEMLNVFNHANQKQGRQQRALTDAVYAAVANIDQLEAILPSVKRIGHKHRALGIKPEQYSIIAKICCWR